MGEAMNGNSEFRWGRGFLHAGLAFVAAMVVGFVALFVVGPADPGKFGEAVGRLACASALFALAASWGRQTGRTWAFLLGGALLAGFDGAGALALPLFLPGAGKLVMLPEEKAEFLRIGDGFLPAGDRLGFRRSGRRIRAASEAQQSLLASLEAQQDHRPCLGLARRGRGPAPARPDLQAAGDEAGVRGLRQRLSREPRPERAARSAASG